MESQEIGQQEPCDNRRRGKSGTKGREGRGERSKYGNEEEEEITNSERNKD